jgi:hypothetical protein
MTCESLDTRSRPTAFNKSGHRLPCNVANVAGISAIMLRAVQREVSQFSMDKKLAHCSYVTPILRVMQGELPDVHDSVFPQPQ